MRLVYEKQLILFYKTILLYAMSLFAFTYSWILFMIVLYFHFLTAMSAIIVSKCILPNLNAKAKHDFKRTPAVP